MIDIVSFSDAHIAGASALLFARLPELRSCLPNAGVLADDACAHEAIDSLWETPGASGAVALEDGRVAGYLLGLVEMPAPRSTASLFQRPRSIHVPLQGAMIADGEDASRLVPQLYAAASASWTAMGCFDHAVSVAAADVKTQDTWAELGFGHRLDFGVREVASPASVVTECTGVAFRRATPDDLEAVVRLVVEQLRSLARPPVFLPYLAECRGAIEEEHAGLLADRTAAAWLAEEAGEALAVATLFPHPSGIVVPERTLYLQYLVTAEASRDRGPVGPSRLLRRRGIGSALVARAAAWAKGAGYRTLATSWLSANRPMARFVLRQGFQRAYLKMERRLDERIAWAKGAAAGH